VGSRAGKKLSTLDETKALIKEGKSLREIVKARDLTVGTILDHAEKIKKTDCACSLSALAQDLTKSKVKKVEAAFLKIGVRAGTYQLSSVKELLEMSVSYDEIRLVWLLMSL
jgi:uncharacterized protein YpbB